MKMKKRDLLQLSGAIQMLAERESGVKFSYFVAKNKVAMRDEITALEEARQPNESYKEFDQKRAELAQKLAEKNPDGTPQIQNQSFVITSNFDAFQKELESLKGQYTEAIDAREKQIKEFNDIIDEEVEFNGTKIALSDLPANIEAILMEALILADLILEDA